MIKKITRQQLIDMMKYGSDFTLVDVRSTEDYDREHIRGAISVPLDTIAQKAEQVLAKENLIVTYCTSFQCQASTKGAENLASMGFTNLADYKGGILDYKSGSFELEGKLHEHVACGNGCCNC